MTKQIDVRSLPAGDAKHMLVELDDVIRRAAVDAGVDYGKSRGPSDIVEDLAATVKRLRVELKAAQRGT